MYYFRLIRRRFRKYCWVIEFIAVAFGFFVYWNYKCGLRILEGHNDQTNISIEINPQASAMITINPPRFISRENREYLLDLSTKITISKNGTEKGVLKSKLNSLLSNVVQNQLVSLQLPQNCSGPNVVCGHHDRGCGLGCQIHHRVTCLMVSYALGVPLIHDERNWAYSDTWNSVFLPLGCQCEVGPETYVLSWRFMNQNLYKQLSTMSMFGYSNTSRTKYNYRLEYPLKNGIPVSKEIADLVEIISPFPFIWWVGQFMKFALRLNPDMQERIQKAKREINYTHPIVGLHVRRTDKVKEDKAIMRPIEHYMYVADEYYNVNSDSIDGKDLKSVFIASEDATVFRTAKRKYPNWNIIGFPSRKTRWNPISRHSGLFEIVTDLFLLLESDLIVCCFSSNICRLLYEMQGFFHTDGKKHLISLHGNYYYLLYGHLVPLKILKIDNDNGCQ